MSKSPNGGSGNLVNEPAFRSLRGYAFDPSLSLKMDTADINSMVYKVAWEENLGPGPDGEYIQVIDYDPTVDKFYAAVDLNHPHILAQEGLNPSESNPMFHQQMVYAVAMTTIANFEKALGRKVIWAPREVSGGKFEEYVQKLRIYPHALREANAYYSPSKKALLFGYFSAVPANHVMHMPDALVFTCLSHDIIAHEVTHAILDGMHYYYNQATNPDVLAFHESFADIVALFQHFTFPEVLKHQIAQSRGNLESQNLLGKLAQEFGAAIGSYGSLRDAIGEIDKTTNQWKAKEPSPDDYLNIMEPHARGSILVAAVFEAFLNIYKQRVADLLRIATNGTGVLPQGELPPDLVNRLADEASKSAKHVLNMCIRALDYCPPVDITFGEYLRAIITADFDLVREDQMNYRLAFIDAFRKRGIYPTGVKTLSEESLRYKMEPYVEPQTKRLFDIIINFLKDFREKVIYLTNREEIYDTSRKYISGVREEDILGLHERIFEKFEDSTEFEVLTGLIFTLNNWQQYGLRTLSSGRGPSFRIQNLRLVSRTSPDGRHLNQIIFSITQRIGILVNDSDVTSYEPKGNSDPEKGFQLWGGSTMVFDLDTVKLKYAIAKPLLDPDELKAGKRVINKKRALSQHKYITEDAILSMSEHSLHFNPDPRNNFNEPFAMLHTH